MCKQGESRKEFRRSCSFSTNPFDLGEQFLLFVSAVMITWIAIRSYFKVRYEWNRLHHEKHADRRFILKIFIASVIASVIFVYTVYFIFGIARWIPFYVGCEVSRLPIIPLIVGRILQYSFLLYRLALVFDKDSFFRIGYSLRQIRLVVSVITVLFIWSTSFYLYLQFLHNCKTVFWHILPLIVLDSLTMLTVCWMYVRNFQSMYHLTVCSRMLDDTLSEQQLKMIRAMTKLTVLTLVSVATTVLLTGVLSWVLDAGFYALDCVISTLCIALAMKHNNKLYKKCCRPLHYCLQKCLFEPEDLFVSLLEEDEFIGLHNNHSVTLSSDDGSGSNHDVLPYYLNPYGLGNNSNGYHATQPLSVAANGNSPKHGAVYTTLHSHLKFTVNDKFRENLLSEDTRKGTSINS